MKNKIISEIEVLEKLIVDINDLESLKQLKSKFTTKSSLLIELKNELKISNDKAKIGKLINEYNSKVNEILRNKKIELENKFEIEERENPILNKKSIELEEKQGFGHPVSKITKILINYLDSLGYEFSNGFEIEDEYMNFDRLNIPSDHPARTMQDTFYIEEEGKLLRTHSTNITARHLEETTNNNLKAYSFGTVFRNDENDSTHSFQFNQMDIFRIGDSISIADLKWLIDTLMKEIFENISEVRFRPSYFPFTEPSFEVDIKQINGEWMEVLGCGMIHPNVIKKAGKNPSEIQGFAIGLGLERLAMLKYKINDIRNFFENDINFLMEKENENIN